MKKAEQLEINKELQRAWNIFAADCGTFVKSQKLRTCSATVTTDEMKQAKIMRLAERIGNDLAPWERDDYNMDEIVRTLEDNPLVVVEWLIDRFMD